MDDKNGVNVSFVDEHCLYNWTMPNLAGNVADMSRHVADDTPCRSNFGQMGPCRRHNFFDVVGVCVGSSRHLLDFSEFVCRNILWWYGGTYAQILSTHSVMFSSLSCSGG